MQMKTIMSNESDKENINENLINEELRHTITDEKEAKIDEDFYEENKEKGWFLRTFGKLGPGSMRASILNLSILSIGIGTLTIPKKFESLSILFCSLVVIIAGIATYITLNMVINAGRKRNITDYALVVKDYLGNKMGKFLDVVVIINLTGINILYQIISK